MQDSLLKRATCSPYTPKALMPSTGGTWEESAPHTLGCFGVVRPITGWCDAVFGVHLFMRCNAHTCLLRATEMPSKNYHGRWACQRHNQKQFGAMLTDCSYPQPAPLNSATLEWTTQNMLLCLYLAICIFKNQFRTSHLFVTWLNSTLFSRS